jgi:hypothetical protein
MSCIDINILRHGEPDVGAQFGDYLTAFPAAGVLYRFPVHGPPIVAPGAETLGAGTSTIRPAKEQRAAPLLFSGTAFRTNGSAAPTGHPVARDMRRLCTPTDPGECDSGTPDLRVRVSVAMS